MRDRGVLASTECIQQLKEAQARQRNAEGKVWTLTDIEITSSRLRQRVRCGCQDCFAVFEPKKQSRSIYL
jgi:hypothetical protein